MDGEQWRNEEMRQKMRQQLQDSMRQVGNSSSSAIDMENQIFSRAKNKEDYLNIAAKLLVHITQKGKMVQHAPRPVDPSTLNLVQHQQPQNMGGITVVARQPFASYANQNNMNLRANQPGMVKNQTMPMTAMPQGPPQKVQSLPQVSAASPMHPIPSPSSLQQPSPSPAAVTAAVPVSKNAPNNLSAISAAQTPPNTTMPNVISSANAEEQAYLEKWKQLQRYVEPLKRMIKKWQREEDRKKDLQKMMNVLDILSDSSRRVPMQMLLKIERALEQIELGRPAGSIGPPTPARKADGLGQPLLDALQASVKAPLLNHSLKRTFAPTLDALFGEPPNKRASSVNSEKTSVCKLPDCLQGEIAALRPRYKISLQESYAGDSVQRLSCIIKDKKLPIVLPLLVEVSHQYPDQCPRVLSTMSASKGFLQQVACNLEKHLLDMPKNYSFTTLLNMKSALEEHVILNKTINAVKFSC